MQYNANKEIEFVYTWPQNWSCDRELEQLRGWTVASQPTTPPMSYSVFFLQILCKMPSKERTNMSWTEKG